MNGAFRSRKLGIKHRVGPAQVESLGEWQDAAWRATQGSGAAAVQLDLEAVAFLALHLRGALAALAAAAPPSWTESGPPPGASAGAPSHRVAAGFRKAREPWPRLPETASSLQGGD